MKLKRYVRLGVRHFGILIHAFCVVAVVRFALTFVKYRVIAKWITIGRPSNKQRSSPYLVAWAVKHSSRLVPFASCLTQALALQFMLARLGYSASVRVGVKPDESGVISAHAWVIWDDIILIGGTSENVSTFTPMVDLKPG